MADNRNLHVILQVEADTKKAKQSLQGLLTDLQKIQSTPTLNFDDVQLKKASAAAQELQKHLLNATNVNTGKLDLTKFSTSLSQSDKKLEDLYKDLIAMGDQGQQAFLKVAQSISQADAPLLKANTKVQEFLGTLKNTARWQISSSILHGFMGAIQSAYGYAQDLNKSLNNIQIVTGHNSEYMANFAKKANEAAQALSTTTTRYTDAALIYYQQGLNDQEVEKRVEATIKMANASRQSAEEVSSQLTAIWNNFYDGSKSLEYYADVITALGAATASSAAEISSGIQKFASIGETVGLSYEYAASALATVTATTRESAETVGNALKTLFARLQGLKLGDTLEDGTTLNKYSSALASVGVDIKDANGELKDMDNILDELMVRWEELDRSQQTALAQTVAGQRQYAQFMTLMNNSEAFKENLDIAYDSEGTVTKQAEIYATSWEASSNRVRAALEEIYEELVDESFFTGLNNALTVTINQVSNLIKGMGGLPGLLTVVGSFITEKLAKEAPAALAKITQDISIISGKAVSQTSALLGDSSSFLGNVNTEEFSESNRLLAEQLSTITSMKQQLIDKQGQLTAAEKETYEQQIKNTEEVYKAAQGRATELDNINKNIAALENQAAAESNKDDGEVKVKLYEYSELIQTLEELKQTQASFKSQVNIWDKQITDTEELRTKTLDYLNTLRETGKVDFNNDKLQMFIKKLTEGELTASQIKERLKDLSTDSSIFQDMSSSAAQGNQSIEQLEASVAELEGKLKDEFNISEEFLNSLKTLYQNKSITLAQYNQLLELIKKNASGAITHTASVSEAITRTTGTLMAFSGAINSMKRLKDVFSDKDASTIDKISAAIGAFVTMQRLASSVTQTLSTWMAVDIGVKEADTAATRRNTEEINRNKIAMAGHPILAIAVLIASVAIPAIIGLTSKVENNTEKLKENLETSKKLWETKKEELESNNDLIDSYKDALKIYQETGEGKEALVEIADKVCEAFDIENGKVLLAKGYYDELTSSIYEARKAQIQTSMITLNGAKEEAQGVFDASIKKAGTTVDLTASGNYDARGYSASQDYQYLDVLEFTDHYNDGWSGGYNISQILNDAVNSLDLELTEISNVEGHMGDILIDISEGTSENYIKAYNEIEAIVNKVNELELSGKYKDWNHTKDKQLGALEEFLGDYREDYETLIELNNQYANLDIERNVYDISDKYKTQGPMNSDTFDQMRQEMVDMATAELKAADARLTDEEATKEATKAVDAYISILGTYNDYLEEAKDLEAGIAEAKDKNTELTEDEIKQEYKKLNDEEKKYFLQINWELVKKPEDIQKQCKELQEKADKEQVHLTIRTQLEAVEDSKSKWKEKMSASEKKDFESSSGIDWGNEEANIISYNEFLKMTYQEQVAYLDSLQGELRDRNLEDLKEERRELSEERSQNTLDYLHAKDALAELEKNKPNLEDFVRKNGDFDAGGYSEALKKWQEELNDKAIELNNIEINEENFKKRIAEIDATIEVNTILNDQQIQDEYANLGSKEFKQFDTVSLGEQKALTELVGDEWEDYVDKESGQILGNVEEFNKLIQEGILKGIQEGKVTSLGWEDVIKTFADLDKWESVIGKDTALYQALKAMLQETDKSWTKEIKSISDLDKAVDKGKVKDFAEGWKQVGQNIKEMSMGDFLAGLAEFDESQADEKAEYISSAIGKINNIASATPAGLKILKDALGEDSDEWEKVSKQVDLTGKSFEEIRQYKDILEPETLAKYNKQALETCTDINELKIALREGQVEADNFSKKIKELLEHGDITLQEALDAVYDELYKGNLTSKEASDAIDSLLSQSGTTTEERLEAIKKKIDEGIASAKDYEDLLKGILGNEDMGLDEKAAALKATHKARRYNGSQLEEYEVEDFTKEEQAKGFLELANDSSASLDQIKTYVNEAIAAMQAADAQGEISVGNWKTYGAEMGTAIKNMGEEAIEYFPKIAEGFGLTAGEDNSGMAPDQLIAFGETFQEVLNNMAGTSEEKITYAQQFLSNLGLTFDEVGIKAKDFSDKAKDAVGNFTVDSDLTVAENLKELNKEFAKTHDIEGYEKALKELLTTTSDWTMSEQDALQTLYKFEMGLAKQKGTLNKTATTLGKTVKSFENYEDLIQSVKNVTQNYTTIQKAQTSALTTLAKQYSSCTRELEDYEAALRTGNKQQIKAKEAALELAGRSAEIAQKFGLEESQVKALAQSYKELGTVEGRTGEYHELTAEEATDLAARYLNLNEGIADLQSNWEGYSEALQTLTSYQGEASSSTEQLASTVADYGSELNGLQSAVAQVLNLQNADAISLQFLAENANLVEQAMNGDAEAVAALQQAFAKEIQAKIAVDDAEFQKLVARVGVDCENLADWLTNLPEGEITGNDLDFVNTLYHALAEAGYTAEEIENYFSGIGIDIDTGPIEEKLTNDIPNAVQQSSNAVTNNFKTLAQNINTALSGVPQKIAEALGFDTTLFTQTDTAEDEVEAVGYEVQENPVTVEGKMHIPRISSSPKLGEYVSGTELVDFSATYPGAHYEPVKSTEKQVKEQSSIAQEVKTAHYTKGGHISSKNQSGANKKSNGSSSGNKNKNSGSKKTPSYVRGDVTTSTTFANKTTSDHTPETVAKSETYDDTYYDRKSYNKRTHTRKDLDNALDSIENYMIENPEEYVARIFENPDKTYTQRYTYYNKRYEKDREFEEKEYLTKDSITYRRASEEIDRYHDINKALDRISYKLQEIDERKSRAFGKAHIDALNEERVALEEQLKVQEDYITELANERQELKTTMEAQGWEFDENGGIANYFTQSTANLNKVNRAQEEYVENMNESIKNYNEAGKTIAKEATRQDRERIDYENKSMQQITDESNAAIEAADEELYNKQVAAVAERQASENDMANYINETNQEIWQNRIDSYGNMVTEENRRKTDYYNQWEKDTSANEEDEFNKLTTNEENRLNKLYGNNNIRNGTTDKNGNVNGRPALTSFDNLDKNIYYTEDEIQTAWTNDTNRANADKAAREKAVEEIRNEADEQAEDIYLQAEDEANAVYQAVVAKYSGKYTNDKKKAKAEDAISEAKKIRDAAISAAQQTLDNAKTENSNIYDAAIEKIGVDYSNTINKINQTRDNQLAKTRAATSKAESQIQNEASISEDEITNAASITQAEIDADFEASQNAVNRYVNQESGKIEREYKNAENKLKTEQTKWEREADHRQNVAEQEAKQLHEEQIREIQSNHDQVVHDIDNKVQDMKDATDEWFDEKNEENQAIFDENEKNNELIRDQAEFIYEENKKNQEAYDELENTQEEAIQAAQEIRNKLYDNALEVIDYTLNLKVEISNNVIQALTALLDALGDGADKANDRIANLASQMSQFTYQTSATRTAINNLINSQQQLDTNIMSRFMNGNFTQDDLNKLFNTDQFTADKITQLEGYRDNLISLISQQRTLKEQMFETVSGAFSEYQDSLNKQMEKITSLTKITQTYQSIVGIVGKKVLDASGVLSEALAKSAFETQRDQTHTYKSILDEIDSNIADMKQKQQAYNPDSEMFKDFQKQIDEMESERRSAQDNWLSSWEAELQAASNYYANAIDTITMHFEQSISGLIGSLDLLSKEYNRQKEIQDIYVDDYEKIYQLSKLTRDVQNAIDDTDHVKNKQQLKKLQDQINKANADGVKMSQYDLDVLRKKFELELARAELEESRDAKSRVRMTRDSEGNYGYVYTADADAVAKAEQSYEDKLHELQVLNSNYIEQLESNYLQLQQNVRDEIASLDITQFATEEEYLAEVDRIQQAAIEKQERMSQQMSNALGNNRDLYENEWTTYSQMTGYKISADEDYLDKFNETTYSVLTGFSAMNEAKAQFTESLAEAILGAIEAYRTTAAMQEAAMEDGGTTMKDFSKDAIASTEEVTEETKQLATEAETLSETFQDAFGQIADSAAQFADNYVKNIQPVIDSNLKLLDTIAKIIEHQANLGGGSGDGSGSGGKASGVTGSTVSWNAFATAGSDLALKSKIGEYLPYVAAMLIYGGVDTNYGGWGSAEDRRNKLIEVFGTGADEDINKFLNEHAGGDLGSYWIAIKDNKNAYSYDQLKKMSFDTGGYTGNWNSLSGKLAMIHEKELILNQEDTKNILSAVDTVRRITQLIDLNALSAGSFMTDILSAANINSSKNEVLQQEVHITAEFPNATDRDEIIEAFDNLTNLALQYAGKQNYA